MAICGSLHSFAALTCFSANTGYCVGGVRIITLHFVCRVGGVWQPQKVPSRQSLCNTKEQGIIKALCIHTHTKRYTLCVLPIRQTANCENISGAAAPMSAPFESLSLFQLSTVCFFGYIYRMQMNRVVKSPRLILVFSTEEVKKKNSRRNGRKRHSGRAKS